MSLRRLLPLLLAGAIGLWGGGGQAEGTPAAPGLPAAAGLPAAPGVLLSTDLEGARDLARRALAAGRPDLAVEIARQILAQAPGDAGAHLLLAAGLTRAGVPGQAVPVARRGFRLADSRARRFEAAWLIAEAQALAGRPLAAKVWLRRADGLAPGPEAQAVVATAWRNVSAQSRLTLDLQLFAGPSENVNGGSLHDTWWYMGIPLPVTEALPGTVWGGALQAGLALTPRTSLSVLAVQREVTLDARARARDPSARGRDYRKQELSFGLTHVWQAGDGVTAAILTARAGRRWTGGTVSADLARLGLELRRAMGEDWSLTGRLSVEQSRIPDRPAAGSIARRASLAASHGSAVWGGVTLELGAAEVDSAAAGLAWAGPVLSLGWRPVLPTDRIGLDIDLDLERRDYLRTPGLEPDLWAALSVTAELPGLATMGFNPTVTLSAERTKSDVVVRDSRDLGISFGLASRF